MTHPTPEPSGQFGNSGGVPGAPAQNFPAQNPYLGQPLPGQGQPQFQAHGQAFPGEYQGQQFPGQVPAQYPAQPQGQQYPGQQVPAQAQFPGGAAPGAAPGKSPFAAITVRDYIVDALALTLLVISLFLPWRMTLTGFGDVTGVAAARIDVLLVTILSILSLGLTYVWRAGAFGPSWNYRRMQDVRLLANAPYLLTVLVYLVMEMVNSRVLGAALAFGLAGALLAATPRQAEMGDPQADAGRDRRWLYALVGLAGLPVLTTLVQAVKLFVTNAGISIPPLYLVSAVFLGLLTPALFAVTALNVLAKSQTWRLVGIGIGVGGLLLGFIAMSAPTRVAVGFYGASPAFNTVFWMAFGAIAAAPSLGRLVTGQAPLVKWQSAAQAAMKLALAGSAAVAVAALINLVRVFMGDTATRYYYSEGAVPWVLTLVFSLLAAGGYFVAAAALKNGTRQGQQLATAYAGLLFVLFLVLVIVGGNTPTWPLMGPAVLLAFVFPAAIATILWAPKAMRGHFGALPSAAAAQTGFTFDGASPAQAAHPGQVPGQQIPAQQIPGQQFSGQQFPGANQAPDPARPGAGFDPRNPYQPSPAAQYAPAGTPEAADPAVAEAANPATPPERLHELAVSFPQTHAAIAANPSVYPGLSDWLAAQGTVPAAVEHPAAGGTAAEDDGAMTAPITSRAEDSSAGIYGQGQQAEAAPSEPVAAGQAGVELFAEASDPATSPIRLHELASADPALHAAIAGNPSAYPQLLEWLAGVDSPGVAEALRRR